MSFRTQVEPNGPATSKVMFITDLPEHSDGVKGRVFSSKQGWLLNKMLGDIGQKLSSFYCTSTILNLEQPPPPILKSRAKLTKWCSEHSRSVEDIKREITAINPNVIIPVGEWPLQLLCKVSPITRFQGSILSLNPGFEDAPKIKVVPIQHPRDIFKVYSIYYYTPVYLKRALDLKDSTIPFKERLNLEIIQNYQGLRNYLNQFANSPYLVTDIETYYNQISCIGVSLSSDSAVTIPLLEQRPSPPELVEMLKLLQRAFNRWPIVNQNVGFDHTRLERYGFVLPNILGDTMLNMGVIYPELPKNLGFINSLFTNIPYFKDEGKGYAPCKQLYLYCAKDCVSTYRIYDKQMKDAEELGVKDFIQNKMMKFYPVYRDMSNQGIQVDTSVRDELNEKYTMLGRVYTAEVKDLLGYEINPLSSKQCCDLFYRELNLPVQKKLRADGKYTETGDEDAIEYLILNHVESDDIKNLLLKILYTRKVEKILGYVNIALHPGSIFRSSWNLVGTETGRTSTSKSGDRWYEFDEKNKLKFTELGFAAQTLPKHGFELPDGTRLGDDIRKMFVPREGYIFCEGDQSKAEAVIVTVLAKDWDLYDKFYTINLHKVTAVDLELAQSIETVTYDEYRRGKTARHTGNYDGGAKTFAALAMISMEEAKQLLAKFHEKYWKIRAFFHKDVQEHVSSTLWLNTPYGRRRDFFVNPSTNQWIREAYAYIPQSTVSDKTKIAMAKGTEVLNEKKIDFHMLSESHDSLLSEVRIGQEDEYSKIMKELFEEPIDMRKCCIPRDIDAVIQFEDTKGMNWKDMI